MNVCVLTHTFPRNNKDATAAFMKEFADGLVENGNKVTVVTPYDQKLNRARDKFKIVIYKYIWPESLHAIGYGGTMQADVELKSKAYFLAPFLVIFGVVVLAKTIRRNNINVVNAHWVLPNGLIALIACRVLRVPYVITIPGTDTLIAKKNIVFKILTKIVVAKSSAVVSNSQWLLKQLVVDKSKRTKIVSYPVDVSAFRPVKRGLTSYRKRHRIEGKQVLLAVGRLVYKKGFKYLIESMPGVLSKYPDAVLLIGGDGDLRDSLWRLAEKLDVSKNVIFLGNINRDEMIYYYNLADVMIAPSVVDKNGNVDGGPVVSFESMACGKPQIVSNVLGVANFIENGEGGYKVPPEDPGALTVAIIKLLSSSKLRARMGQKNRKLVTSEFSTQKIGEKYTEIFQDVV